MKIGAQDIIVSWKEGYDWIFLKVTTKRATKRMVHEFLCDAWNIRTRVKIQQTSSNIFKLGFVDRVEYDRVLEAKWV